MSGTYPDEERTEESKIHDDRTELQKSGGFR